MYVEETYGSNRAYTVLTHNAKQLSDCRTDQIIENNPFDFKVEY
jgi:hypothetical protein